MDEPVPKIDYASPASPKANASQLFGVLGILIGAFGCLMLLFGGIGLYFANQHPNWVSHQSDMDEGFVFLALGAFCVFICFRWCKGVFNNRSGRR